MRNFKVLPRTIYEPTADIVARNLLGQWLVRKTARGYCAGAIVEVEAYIRGDAAAHSFRGETPRNRVMFGPPGHVYVYFIYGNHWCVNAVCRPRGIGEAVLIRAVEPVMGLDFMQRRRPAGNPIELTNGPGKLCAAMDIDHSLNGADLCDEKSPLFIAKNPRHSAFMRMNGPVITTTRIGITKAAALPLRFYLEANPYVTRRVKKAVELVPSRGLR